MSDPLPFADQFSRFSPARAAGPIFVQADGGGNGWVWGILIAVIVAVVLVIVGVVVWKRQCDDPEAKHKPAPTEEVATGPPQSRRRKGKKRVRFAPNVQNPQAARPPHQGGNMPNLSASQGPGLRASYGSAGYTGQAPQGALPRHHPQFAADSQPQEMYSQQYGPQGPQQYGQQSSQQGHYAKYGDPRTAQQWSTGHGPTSHNQQGPGAMATMRMTDASPSGVEKKKELVPHYNLSDQQDGDGGLQYHGAAPSGGISFMSYDPSTYNMQAGQETQPKRGYTDMSSSGGGVQEIESGKSWKHFQQNITKDCVLMLYSDNCGHCQTMKPAYAQAAKSVPMTPFYRLNIGKAMELAQEYHLSGVPWVARFSPNGNYVEYKGDRSANSLMEFARYGL